MNIWIDGYEANVEQRLGSSQVAFELLQNLARIDLKNVYTILLPSPPLGDMPPERVGWQYKVLQPKFLWTRIALPAALYIAKEKPDLIFSPTHYGPMVSPIPSIITIFDLSYLHFPNLLPKVDLWKLKYWSKSSAKKADRIITISNYTKREIMETYGINNKKIVVAHPGYRKDLFKPIKDSATTALVLDKYGIAGKYLLYIGTIQPKKNLVRLIEAFAEVLKTHPLLKLVIVGKTSGLGRSGWMFEEIINKPAELGINSQVVFTGFVPTEELPLLLSGAIAFVLPSLWEGFGIPVVESMAVGTPVIVSNVSALPEVVGNAGLLVDPDSTEQIAQAIRTIVADKKLRAKLAMIGGTQAKKYSWEKMAKIVLKTFGEIT